MSILGLYSLASNAMAAQNAGVATAGRNVANANTHGYQREEVDLESQLAAPLVGGVLATGVRRGEDPLLAGRERASDGDVGLQTATSTALTALDQQLTGGANDLSSSLADFWGAVTTLGATPSDASARGALLSAGQSLATMFQQTSASIGQAQSDSDGRIAASMSQASTYAQQIADANRALSVTPNDPVLKDKRDQAARSLAALTGGQARIDPNGKMSFVINGGQVVVDGDHASTLRATPDAAYGNHMRIDIVDGPHVTDVTKVVGGSLGGEIAFRDGSAATAATQLDQLAYDVSTQINAVHATFAGEDGVSGRNFFSQPATAAGAAASFAVDPAIVADPTKIAAAAAGAGPSDGSGLTALLALQNQPLAAGGTQSFSDAAISLLGGVGTAAKAASDQLDTAKAKSDGIAAARDSLSGVSQDEEMANLAAFQRASEAATKFLATVDDILSNLIQNI